MSQENVEIVRAAYDAFNRGDRDVAFRDMHPQLRVCVAACTQPWASPRAERGAGAYGGWARGV